MPHQPVAAGLLGEATVVGCKLYSVTSDPRHQGRGWSREKQRKWALKIIKRKTLKGRLDWDTDVEVKKDKNQKHKCEKKMKIFLQTWRVLLWARLGVPPSTISNPKTSEGRWGSADGRVSPTHTHIKTHKHPRPCQQRLTREITKLWVCKGHSDHPEIEMNMFKCLSWFFSWMRISDNKAIKMLVAADV